MPPGGWVCSRKRVKARVDYTSLETPAVLKKMKAADQTKKPSAQPKKADAKLKRPLVQAEEAGPQCQKEAALHNEAADQTNKSSARAKDANDELKRPVVQDEEAAPQGQQEAAQGEQALAHGHLEAAQ